MSHVILNGSVLLYVHRNRRLIRDGNPDGHLDLHTQLLICVILNDDDELMLNVLRCHLTY